MDLLTSRDRVFSTLNHQKTDRLPRGELLIEESFLDRIYPKEVEASYHEKMKNLAEDIDLDVITVRVNVQSIKTGLDELRKWVAEQNYFIMPLIDGLFWKPDDPVSFQEFLVGVRRRDVRIRDLIALKKKNTLQLVRWCLREGAHGCIIGDDFAYNHGLFISPKDFQECIFPGLRDIVERVKKYHGVVFLHSCGDLTKLIDLVVSAGFDGVHGLAPSAGNDLQEIKKKTDRKLTLMGCFEIDSLNPSQIETLKKRILGWILDQGGYILGSSGGLSLNTPIDSFRALYRKDFL
jgi:uroporphyrinogen decarboxylase